MDINPYDQFDDSEDPYAQFDSFDTPVPERTLGSTLKDTGISLAKGVIGAGQGIVGLADIPTGGRVGRGLEHIGIKPEEWQADLSEEYSLAQQEANKKVDAAKGFVDTAQAMLENPSTIAHGIVETLPSVATGGVLGRGAMALSSRLVPKAVTTLGKTGSAIGAGAVGEGAISAGQTAEQIRNATPDDLLTAEQSALAVVSGLGTTAFGIVGGSLAKKLGFADIDTMVISGLNPAKKEGFKGVVKSIIGGGITEGVFEELPQTVQETIFTNAALDKPLLEGVPEGAAQAIILGGVMGAGANLLPGVDKPAEKTEQELELDRRAANILNLKEDELGQIIQKLTTDINSNQELIKDLDKLEAKARKENVAPAEVIRKIVEDNKNNQSLLDRINSGRQKKEELVKKEYEALSPEEKQAKEIENKLAEKRIADAQKINEDLDTINKREEIALKQYKDETDPTKKASIADRIFNLKKEKNTLLDRQLQQKTNQTSEFSDPKKADEIRQEKENFYNSLWLGGVNKDANESAQVFGEKSTEQQDILDRLSTQIANTQSQQKKQELQKVYDGLFQTFERDASESAETIANADTSQFDQIVRAKDQERLNSVLEEIVIEPDPQARQTLYEKMFMQPGVKDAAASAEVFAAQGEDAIANQRKQELQKVMSSITQESDPAVRQKLYNQMFLQPGVKNAQESAEVFLTQKFTEREKSILEGYWQEVKKELNLRNEKMTPGTEAFMRKKFFETQLTEIEKDVQQDAKIQSEAKQNVVPSLAEQNKRQVRFRQIAESLGDVPSVNRQAVQTEVPRNLPGGLQSGFTNEQQVAGAPQFQATENQEALGKVNLEDIKKTFPNQTVTQHENGSVSVQFKNGQGLTINSIQGAGQGLVKLAIETGQMSKTGKILGITVENEILLDENFADNKTLWHENKHVLDNLGLITEADDSALNKEFNKLRKAGKLDFALSTHKDPKQRMVENRANMFAQIMVNRAEYRNTAFGKVIQRVIDFFQQLFSFGKQTVSGLAREVESGKIYERQAEALREGMPMFEVREAPVQKISDDVYHQMYSERNSLVRTIGQTLRMRGHEIKQLIDKGLGSISTRLKNVDPMLRAEIRNLDFRTAQKIVTALRIAHPLLEKTKQMSPQDKFVWDAARRNSDEGKIKEIAAKYNMTADQEKLRTVLDQISQDAIDVGYDVGFIEEYWPRIIKDQEGFLQATKGISQRPVITDAIKVYADKLGMTVEKFEIEYPEQAADIASNTILGRNLGIGGPGNIQARQYETVPPELNKFYMDSDAALMQYIYSMTKKIEARRFFGKVPERIATLKAEKKRKQVMLTEYEKSNNTARIEDVSGDLLRIEQELDKYKLQRDYTENIGTYINDLRMSGRIQADDEKVVRDILDARFHEHGATGIVNAYKNMSYIDVMGSPISALTQIGDLAWAMYVGKVWTPRGLADTIKNVGKAITKKSEITKEDLGIERIAQEFADGTTLGNAVSWVFKKVGLERIDSIGKETLINNAFSTYKAMASTEAGRTELLKQIKPIFGTQSESVINDLLANNPTDNVKMLLYHRLLDFQPVALSEMSEQYLKSGNGRVFYMLKTYTLKQFDVFRNEAWHKIKTGERDQVIEGIGNMIKLVSLLTLANAGADELKDWMLGKETKFEDHVIENFLTMGGASKYVRMQTTREGLGSGLIGQILPPFRFVNSISKDLNQLYGSYITGDTIDFDHARIVESIPIGGKLYYWHYGRGEDYKKSSNEQEFGKVSKEVDIFKKQLENSEDKRTFLNSNLDGFKQMKVHENFQSALNRNQAVINKLKKIDQTTNVRERLGQLQQQREVILKRYFEVTNTVQ